VHNARLLVTICPDCDTSPETRQRVEDEQNRRRLAHDMTLDTIVFVRGKAKVLGDATAADLKSLAQDADREAAQDLAWAAWFEAAAAARD
jgi:hypothetical protein